MANYIYVGRIVGTHGLKGELKIISDEVFLDKIFKPNNNLYIGDEYQKEQIATYRIHKNYNLVSLTNHQDINRINDFLNKDVYINKEEIDVEYLLSDLIDCDIIDDQKYGKVIDIEKGKGCNYLKVKYNKVYFIPIIGEYIKEIDCSNKIIKVRNAKSLII